ncbi:MAG: hypothetical protein PGMFKBFP_02647 [Anaerolineales bacterium]|nr:hypothetical protein [Anaerolineales bacterium]
MCGSSVYLFPQFHRLNELSRQSQLPALILYKESPQCMQHGPLPPELITLDLRHAGHIFTGKPLFSSFSYAGCLQTVATICCRRNYWFHRLLVFPALFSYSFSTPYTPASGGHWSATFLVDFMPLCVASNALINKACPCGTRRQVCPCHPTQSLNLTRMGVGGGLDFFTTSTIPGGRFETCPCTACNTLFLEYSGEFSGTYFVTAIDFRKSTRLYAKNARPMADTTRNCNHTALKPPPR